ncbi:terminal uridylyltransferase [Geosmithia morbida]|uniref:polynucleotide adenylyltransferase n=1 Tax=Geosmithia morbida TaxID=1094350 RepID=A0A9P4Z0U3_9HYPO|nr:terminal uridylyltransferase [Geosmithia morbida]KAF4125364.1 terminal uridylyltransferase [Geosmithia morbida]
MDPSTPQPTGLEAHLRGLILTNADASSNISHTAHGQQQQPIPALATGPGPGPGPASASPSEHSASAAAGYPPSPRTGRKRLNQAQRRQMNAQLTIPVDPRPSFQQAGRGQRHHPHQQWQPVPPPGPHQRAMSGPSYGPPHGFARGRGNGNAFRGHHQHHASTVEVPSYANGFDGSHNHPSMSPAGWRQAAPQQQQQQSAHSHSHSQPHHYQNQHQHQHQHRRPFFRPDEVANQSALLDRLSFHIVADSEIQHPEIVEKEAFRGRIEQLIRHVIASYEQEQHAQGRQQPFEFSPLSVQLKCFGSLSSGFATKASDMDLALLSPQSQIQPDAKASPIPRLIEKALLDAGIGARLLTRTRVPIIKLCELPPEPLYRNLIANRDKWERGLENEGHEYHDDDEHEHDDHHNHSHNAITAATADDHHEDAAATGLDKIDEKEVAATSFEVPSIDGENQEPQKLYLRQGPGSTLDSYYGTAKRVLRKAGGRDVRGSTAMSFSDLQWDVLNRVCQAFVQGLSNIEVRERLQSFPSLAFKSAYNMPDNHSLMTTFTQIEGEHLVYHWNVWMAEQGSAIIQNDAEGVHAVEAWHAAQRKRDYGVDPVLFNKELHTLLERMRRVLSFQIVSLEQGNEEAPAQYHARAARVLENLRSSNQLRLANGPESTVVKQYIAGIRPREIKSAVSEYFEAMMAAGTVILGLDDVAQRHKSLQLAREFTRALEKGLYDQSQVEDIKEYVRLLQSSLVRIPGPGAAGCLVVPVTQKSAALVSRIRSLQDPHLLAPNQSRYKDHLEFPKTGAGVQCDINFSAHLALQNTALLRCYSHTDPRVRPMVLFVKHWAKVRGINSGYRGTLSSYGYVLMVLHYLVNVAQPFVCPNLQQLAPPPTPTEDHNNGTTYQGYNVHFWRNEEEILHLASMNQLNRNTESIGSLLRGFFEYYAQTGLMSSGHGKGFDWGRDVLSLRTLGGLLSKQEKGWTGAKTVYEVNESLDSGTANSAAAATTNTSSNPPAVAAKAPANTGAKTDDVKEVRLRYLFAIEDPFETDHNVARTVTHNGIVSIRDELRRAWRIIKASGGGETAENLLEDVGETSKADGASLAHLMDDIHGSHIFDDLV